MTKFWKNRKRARFTRNKIKTIFSELDKSFNNDDLKSIFGEEIKGDVWDFVCKSELIKYYYSDYENVEELLTFVEKVNKAYKMALPLTIANKYN